MKKVLLVLVLGILYLSWNFIFTSDRKVDLTDPAKVLQGLSLAIKYKLAVGQYWQQHDTFPDSKAWQALEQRPRADISKSLVSDIRVGEERPGAITVYFSNKDVINVAADIGGRTITLMPVVVNGRLDWVCQGTMYRDLMPEACTFIKQGNKENQ